MGGFASAPDTAGRPPTDGPTAAHGHLLCLDSLPLYMAPVPIQLLRPKNWSYWEFPGGQPVLGPTATWPHPTLQQSPLSGQSSVCPAAPPHWKDSFECGSRGPPVPCCPFLGAVCTLQLNQSEAEMPCGGVFTDLALLGLQTLRVCPGSVLPGPQELCKQEPREGGRPPLPRVLCNPRGQLQSQGAGGGLLPSYGCGGNAGPAKPGDGQGAQGSGHGKPSASRPPGSVQR